VVLAYWPGAPDTATDNRPVYEHRIPVIDTLGVKDEWAIQEWNACGSVQMYPSSGVPFSPGSITITGAWQDSQWPRGGWFEDHGVVFLPTGSWERSVPVMRHEIGHALGFGHTHRWSIMGGSNHVQPIDCQGLVEYYGR